MQELFQKKSEKMRDIFIKIGLTKFAYGTILIAGGLYAG
jgi:hypothetical protein